MRLRTSSIRLAASIFSCSSILRTIACLMNSGQSSCILFIFCFTSSGILTLTIDKDVNPRGEQICKIIMFSRRLPDVP